jgi:hypothetical protein
LKQLLVCGGNLMDFRFGLVLMFVLLALPLVYADVGPGPTQPEVIVHFVKGGVVETTVSNVTYNCMGNKTNATGAVSQTRIVLTCVGGTCDNNRSWFYKFNPCFRFLPGTFSYEFNGKEMETEMFNTSSYTKYEMTVEAETGKITSTTVTIPQKPPTCLPGFLLLVILCGMFGGISLTKVRG